MNSFYKQKKSLVRHATYKQHNFSFIVTMTDILPKNLGNEIQRKIKFKKMSHGVKVFDNKPTCNDFGSHRMIVSVSYVVESVNQLSHS